MIADAREHECLSVIVPVYNEAPYVERVLNSVMGLDCVGQVIVVDDGSSDGSHVIVEQLCSKEPRMLFIRHSRNKGKGAAIHSAIPHIRKDYVVIQDADLEYNPADYKRMLHPLINKQCDVVYGSRYLTHNAADTGLHAVCNKLFTRLFNGITGLHLTDEATCYKMFLTKRFLAIPLREEGFGFCVEISAKLARMKIDIVEVPIGYKPRGRVAGKKLGLFDALKSLVCVFRYSHTEPVWRSWK